MVETNQKANSLQLRYRLGTILVWIGVLAWMPFIVLKSTGYSPSFLWFLPFHLTGVIGGSRLRKISREEMNTTRKAQSKLHNAGKVLVFLGILVWVVYFYKKLVAHSPVAMDDYLPYHLAAILPGVALLTLDFIKNRD